MDVLSVKSYSRDDSKQWEPAQDEEPKEKKCPNLTFNCIYQICDILVALSLIFWGYCLSPKSLDTFSNINEPSLAIFISRSMITLYFAAFSIIIILCTFYYPFKTKSVYFNFYGRGIFFLFLGNIMLLIASISNENILSTSPLSKIYEIYDYGYYTAHYVIGIGILYLLLAIITNPKCGTKCCFLPSPWIELNNGKKLKFKMHSNHIGMDKSESSMEKQLSIVIELASDSNINKNNISESVSNNAWIKNDEKNKNNHNNTNNSNKISKLGMNKTFRNQNKRKSLNDIKKSTTKEMDRRKSEIVMSKNVQTSYNTESFQNRLSIFKNNAAGVSNEKIDKLKNERKENDKEMKQDHEAKRRATIAIQSYATQAAVHSQDINLLNKSLKNITKSNCMEKMHEMGLLFGIYVPINQYQRWDIRSKLEKIIRSEDIKEEDIDNLNGTKKSNTKEYVKMHVFNLRNNALLTKISNDQKEDFYKLIQFSIEAVPNIYMMDFTRSNANKMFLNVIFEALIKRLKKNAQFGPEEILLESNPITDTGCTEIIKYLSQNPPNLRILKLSNSFNNIGSQTVVSFCDVMEQNINIIKFSLDINYLMYNNRMDGYIRRNNNLWRDNKKSNPDNMIKRKSYDLLIGQKSRHKKARRSSVPDLHKSHPSLAQIQGGFSLDKEERKNTYKQQKSQKRHVKRRSSVPDGVLSVTRTLDL